MYTLSSRSHQDRTDDEEGSIDRVRKGSISVTNSQHQLLASIALIRELDRLKPKTIDLSLTLISDSLIIHPSFSLKMANHQLERETGSMRSLQRVL
jgi:hypothetical protein